MTDIIYNTREEAVAACQTYVQAMWDLRERLGICETCDDNCVENYVHAKWRNEDGVIVKYTHW